MTFNIRNTVSIEFHGLDRRLDIIKEKIKSMGVEQKLNAILNDMPQVKKTLKRIYQVGMYAISKKVRSEGDISLVSPQDEYEYFFGYYDKSPWDSSERYVLCLRVKDTTRNVAPDEPAEIILIDTHNKNSFEIIATTNTWNVQQGCMLQWLGPDHSTEIIYNDFRDGEYCSVILNLLTKEEKLIEKPIYSVSEDGKFALTLDFSRLHRLRKGYGYSNIKDYTADQKIPEETCIWYVELTTNQTIPILTYKDFYRFETRDEMIGAEHKVNHIMINPTGSRFMVLHRWYKDHKKYTRLITADIDGKNLYNLSDDNMTSHCNWKSDNEIIAYARKKEQGDGYYLMKDLSDVYIRMWPELTSDGHPSYSPDRTLVVTDTYPDRARIASLFILSQNRITRIARLFAPFKYDNDVRCDLHPRWNRTGDKICFDSVFEGKRRLYVIDKVVKYVK